MDVDVWICMIMYAYRSLIYGKKHQALQIKVNLDMEGSSFRGSDGLTGDCEPSRGSGTSTGNIAGGGRKDEN